ncbi:hypothetical protein [Anaerococcus rubeinfantis]|uniref:hypothetical protein n=1 Tax=Anaerococcus rubeinfantis TaxID=1720199 RepID=UPI00073EDCA3|nr:hypothetical protein [Anaerococcus rubeinfantis]
MEEKEVIKFDKKNERTLTIHFSCGMHETYYNVIDIDFQDEYVIISLLGYEDKLFKEIYKKENILSYKMEFKNIKMVGDEEDGE